MIKCEHSIDIFEYCDDCEAADFKLGRNVTEQARPKVDNWRTLDHDREEFFGWANDRLREKVMVGAAVHGDMFHGNPLDHAIEEAIDLIFYLWMEKRKHDPVVYFDAPQT